MGKRNPNRSKKPCLPEAVIPPAKRISAPPTYDNMIQERYIYSGGRFPKLPCKLEVCSAWRWISAGMVVWVITYSTIAAGKSEV
jgi:hypothetical protein